MANTIKLKQGSGSDPSASDLVLGEPAIRTDTGEIFLKKDDGSIAKVAGGIDDGDKGDITVSNDGATFTIDNDAVTYAKIQNVSATNRILGRDSSGAGVIEEITPANLRTMLNVADGATNVTNTNQLTNGAGFITATLTNEQVQDIVGGMVTGNTESGISVTYQDGDGTLDFAVTSQTDENFTTTLKNKLDGIAASATNVTNNNQLTNGAGFLTSVGTSNISDNAVTMAKLQDLDQNRIFGRVASGSGNPTALTAANVRTMINVEDGATADQSASEILSLLSDQNISTTGVIDIDANNKALRIGASQNLQLTYTGSEARIRQLDGSNPLRIMVRDGAETAALFNANGNVELYEDNTKRFETSSYGSITTGVHSITNGILETKATIATSHSLTSGFNAMAVSPTINSGVTVTVPSGAVFAIV